MRGEAITGPGAWLGSELQDDTSWIHRLDAQSVAEIDTALRRAKRVRARIPFATELDG